MRNAGALGSGDFVEA